MKIRRICTCIGLCAMVLPHPLSAAEPAYPNRPVRLVLGFPPGGATDAMARIVAPKMADATGQSWIVDNRAGAAGTIAAGDRLKLEYGTRIVAVEALECPTMLENGFGEHNIQGIGDKHIPLIHNVMNTDVVCAVSDHATDELGAMFSSEAGRRFLAARAKVRSCDRLSRPHSNRAGGIGHPSEEIGWFQY